jgi:ABC-2 type transport system permease protein
MFADAVASEAYKLWRNRTAWFWGFVFVPLMALVIGLFGQTVIRAKLISQGANLGGMNVSESIALIGKSAWLPMELFALIAAAILFAGEYRWETWRLLAPRNSRLNLMLAKFLIYALGAAFMLIATDVGGVISALVGAMVTHEPVIWGGPPTGAFFLPVFEQFAVAWAQLLEIGAIAALAAVLTRSILATVIVPIVIGTVQAVITGMQQTSSPLLKVLESPGVAADAVRAYLLTRMPDGSSPVPVDLAAQAAISLAGWILIAAAVALVAFRQQDLSKE